MKKYWILGLKCNKRSLESVGINLPKYDELKKLWDGVELTKDQIDYLDQVKPIFLYGTMFSIISDDDLKSWKASNGNV